MGSSWSDISRNFDKNSPSSYESSLLSSIVPLSSVSNVKSSGKTLVLNNPFNSNYTDSSLGRSTAIKLPRSHKADSNDSINSSHFSWKTTTTYMPEHSESSSSSLSKWPTFKNITQAVEKKVTPLLKLAQSKHRLTNTISATTNTTNTSNTTNTTTSIQANKNLQIIRKKPLEKVFQVQNISLIYFRPPTPPRPGDITITQEKDVQMPAVPPLLIRQVPKVKLVDKKPLVIREKPPQPPVPIPAKHITLPGKVVESPPRQVILEKLPKMPAKPPDLVIERWLSYAKRTRNVLFSKLTPHHPAPTPVTTKVKNKLIVWEPPDVKIEQKLTYLGVQECDPIAYEATYGARLMSADQLPSVAKHFKAPSGEVLAADSKTSFFSFFSKNTMKEKQKETNRPVK